MTKQAGESEGSAVKRSGEGFRQLFLRYALRHGYDSGVSAVRLADFKNADPIAVAEAEYRYQHRNDDQERT